MVRVQIWMIGFDNWFFIIWNLFLLRHFDNIYWAKIESVKSYLVGTRYSQTPIYRLASTNCQGIAEFGVKERKRFWHQSSPLNWHSSRTNHACKHLSFCALDYELRVKSNDSLRVTSQAVFLNKFRGSYKDELKRLTSKKITLYIWEVQTPFSFYIIGNHTRPDCLYDRVCLNRP